MTTIQKDATASKKPFTLETSIDKAKWDTFVAGSPQNNIFCRTPFLDALGDEYDLFLVSEEKTPLMGAVVVKKGGMPVIAPYTLYQGILLSRELSAEPSHRKIKMVLETTDFILHHLAEAYPKLTFCLHHTLEDLRSFLWFNYHQPEMGRFRLELSYTGIIDLKASRDFDAYLSGVRKVRRYEYNRAVREGLSVATSRDVDLLDRLHDLTLSHQGLERSAEERKNLRNITVQALENGFGELMVCRTAEGEAASAVLFLFDEKRAYYLFGANHPEHRDSNSGTYLLLEQIRQSYERGIENVDVCGINSPNRGDYKTSLSAEPFPYYTVVWTGK